MKRPRQKITSMKHKSPLLERPTAFLPNRLEDAIGKADQEIDASV
jgi:hypothetical protein